MWHILGRRITVFILKQLAIVGIAIASCIACFVHLSTGPVALQSRYTRSGESPLYSLCGSISYQIFENCEI